MRAGKKQYKLVLQVKHSRSSSETRGNSSENMHVTENRNRSSSECRHLLMQQLNTRIENYVVENDLLHLNFRCFT